MGEAREVGGEGEINMKIYIASLNPQKINAVKELINEYPLLMGAIVEGVAVENGVGEQPKTLEETLVGAITRAKAALGTAEYSFGIESGLMHVPYTKTGVMDICVCAIYDGKDVHLGISSAFEPPRAIAKLIYEQGMKMSDAALAIGLTEDKNIGYSESLIGILTHGRLNRLAYTKQAVMTALIHLENAELFKEE